MAIIVGADRLNAPLNVEDEFASGGFQQLNIKRRLSAAGCQEAAVFVEKQQTGGGVFQLPNGLPSRYLVQEQALVLS